MKLNYSDTLPGFMMFDDFFAALEGPFTPVKLSEEEKVSIIATITSLKGEPKECLMPFRDDFSLTGVVREAREYPDGRLYVRCEFRRLKQTCDWSQPYQFMAVLDGSGKIEHYTVIRGTGKSGRELCYGLSDEGWGEWGDVVRTNDISKALQHLKQSGRKKVGVYDPLANKCDLYVYLKDGIYTVEWFLCCEPWMFSEVGLSFDEVEAVLKTYAAGRIPALASLRKWRQLDYPIDYATFGVYVNVDRALTRLLELSKKSGDEMRMRTVRASGCTGEKINDPYTTSIEPGPLSFERECLFRMSTVQKNEVKAAKLLALSALHGHVKSGKALAERFNSGRGVPVDSELARYWMC